MIDVALCILSGVALIVNVLIAVKIWRDNKEEGL